MPLACAQTGLSTARDPGCVFLAYLVAGAAEDGVGQVANDDIKGAVVLLQLGARVVDDQVHARICEGRLVGLQVLLAEVAHNLCAPH